MIYNKHVTLLQACQHNINVNSRPLFTAHGLMDESFYRVDMSRQTERNLSVTQKCRI